MRINRQQMFMEIASVVAKRSTCFRANVGAIVVRENNIISIGYNGPPSGAEHCTGHTCSGADGCQRSIHAEINAIDRLSSFDLKFGFGSLDFYCTHSPCVTCADAIIDAGFKRMFFRELYRVNDHLRKFQIYQKLYQVQPSGYVIDWWTKELVEL